MGGSKKNNRIALKIQFEVAAHDIWVGVEFESNSKQQENISPIRRQVLESTSRRGTFEVELEISESGTFTVTLDNSHSFLRSKTITQKNVWTVNGIPVARLLENEKETEEEKKGE